jgi:transketolase
MMDEHLYAKCKDAALQMRRDSLRMSLAAGSSGAHCGGGLSAIELIDVLFLAVMNTSADNPFDEGRDRFIMSKGHGVLALYAALKQSGFISDAELDMFKGDGSPLSGHPSMNVARGIEFSSGSLGQGLSLAAGTCLALRRKGNSSSRVYVLLGDGECNEGSVWEAAAFAAHHRLHRLIAIVDRNGLQYDGETREILSMDDLADKWRSFGWQTVVIDGHDIRQIYDALTRQYDRPYAVIADTVKGKGVSFMENSPLWHHARLSPKQYQDAMMELGGNA